MERGVKCIIWKFVRSVPLNEALIAAGLKPIKQLEPGYEDALEIMRMARVQIAPVAWALFTQHGMNGYSRVQMMVA